MYFFNEIVVKVVTNWSTRLERDDFNFEIVNFPFLDGDVPRSPSYGVYISQLIRFAIVKKYIIHV